MSILQDVFRPICASFPTNTIGQRRASWLIFAILAIAVPFASSRTSDVLRCLEYVFGRCIPERRFYRFMGSPMLPWARLWQAAWNLIPHPTTGRRLILALDDFINPKSGEMIFGCYNFFDHSAKPNQSKFVWAQNIVCLGLLKRVKKRWACLPLTARFYHRKNELEKRPIRIGKTHVEFQTKLQQAADMIAHVGAMFAKHDLLVVCDSWFGNYNLWRPLRETMGDRCHLLTRLRCNINIFAPAPPRSGKCGRPRKYGFKLGNASSLALIHREQARSFTVSLYGKIRKIRAFDQVVTLKTLRGPARIVWVFNKSSWIAICSTDLTLTVEEILEFYGARWKIEAGFKELKMEIGSSHTQNRNPNSVNNHLQLCMLTNLLIWIFTDRLDSAPRRRHAVRGRSHFAFSDARRAFIQAVMNERFTWLSLSMAKAPKIPFMTRLLRLVA